ncbi:MAG: signal peptide peptidase SppA, partial [Anaerovoracaceae bacterium]|nr:signal peptide peptidase SppA [Anaerovoracaceae bacterium]
KDQNKDQNKDQGEEEIIEKQRGAAGPRYYNIDQVNTKKKSHLKTALIVIAAILVGVVLLGVACTQMTTSLLGSLENLGGTAYYEEDVILPSDDFIAQIYVEGTIQSYNQDSFGFAYGYQHQWTLDLIDDLIESDNNKGLVIWVDSPGGTIYESDELYLAIVKYKEESQRPVYAVMGDMAASGGYYISAPADKIIANRNTWTGSIGVTLGTFIDISGLLENYGVKTTTITSGKFKAMGSEFEPMTEEKKQIFKGLIEESYLQFVDIIATHRGLSKAQVIDLADGRVYTASQAINLSLVDEIGTLDEAIEDLQETYSLEDCNVEDFYYVQSSWLSGILGSMAKAITKGQSGDLAVLEKLMKSNKELKPMYIFQQ